MIALTLIIQEREGARIQADLLYRKFDFGSCNSLFFEINSLIRRKNSLFGFCREFGFKRLNSLADSPPKLRSQTGIGKIPCYFPC